MRYILLLIPIFLITSCEIYIVEEPHPWDDRDVFTGSFRVEDYSETTEELFTYNITISKDCCVSNQVWIENFYGVGIDIAAQIL